MNNPCDVKECRSEAAWERAAYSHMCVRLCETDYSHLDESEKHHWAKIEKQPRTEGAAMTVTRGWPWTCTECGEQTDKPGKGCRVHTVYINPAESLKRRAYELDSFRISDVVLLKDGTTWQVASIGTANLTLVTMGIGKAEYRSAWPVDVEQRWTAVA
jgi:hypothetical protein